MKIDSTFNFNGKKFPMEDISKVTFGFKKETNEFTLEIKTWNHGDHSQSYDASNTLGVGTLIAVKNDIYESIQKIAFLRTLG